MIEEYVIRILILVCIYALLGVSLNFALGYTGLLNLGHVAFFGVGAYTSAILTKAGYPYILALFAGGLLASLLGWCLAYATRKLKSDYLALATLGFSFVMYSLFVNMRSITNGPLGIPGIPRPSFFGYVFSGSVPYLVFVILVLGFSVWILYRIVHSPFGRLMEACRDDEIGLRVLGKDTHLLKTKVMMISAFFAGIAGSLFAHYLSFIDPSLFLLSQIVLLLTIVIVGGIASLWGSLLAALVIIAIPEALRFLSLPESVVGPGREIVYSVLLLLILLYRPRGLFGRVDLE